MEAIVVTVSALFIIWQIQGIRGDQIERGARGFVLFAEKFWIPEFSSDVKMLAKTLHLNEDQRAQHFDEYAKRILLRLEMAQGFIDRGLMDKEIFFLSFPGDLRDAALYIRHLRHHPAKMPWMIDEAERYIAAFKLLREVEDWNAKRESRPDYDD